MAALIAKTLVKEARRTWRAIAVSTIIRHFNIQAVEIMQNAETDSAKKDIIKRVEGRRRIELFSQFNRDFRKEVKRSRDKISDKQYREIIATIEKVYNKVSANEETTTLRAVCTLGTASVWSALRAVCTLRSRYKRYV